MHPLDPLAPSEIKQTSNIIGQNYPKKTWDFNIITLKEPPKVDVLRYLDSHSDSNFIPRKAFAILFERNPGSVYEAVVNLSTDVVESLTQVKSGMQPMFTATDFKAEDILKQDPDVIRRCTELGFPDMSLVSADAWSITFTGNELEEYRDKRILGFYLYGKHHENDNMYAHPFDFFPVVDILAKKVIRIDDLPIHANYNVIRNEKTLVPRFEVNFVPEALGDDFYRKDVKPIKVVSPAGPSFTVNGHQIWWQKFNLQISFNQKEGLVLHNVTYKDGDKIRPLLYRASIAEMLVPYGDPRPPYHRKAAFDVGACGLGVCTNTLEFGCDCLGSVTYFDGVLNHENGEPKIIKNAICLHEEDAGLLFKHTEYRTGKATLARAQRLVLSFMVTILNYDYAFYWYLNQDASIDFEVKATGLVSTNLFLGTPEELSSTQGVLVTPNVTAQQHQHLFVVRLDTMFDGVKNSVSVIDVKPVESEFGSEENPYGQGFKVVETLLRTTTEAKTNVCGESSRVWRISNHSSLNKITGKPVGWNLVPKNGPTTVLAKPGSFIRERGEFATHSVWVTQYNPEEIYPSGNYINQAKRDGGFTDWTKDEKNIENEDIVLWHVFGLNHIPRIEDFPIMPVETCGFALKPNNFFLANPGLDIPPPRKVNEDYLTDLVLGCCSSEPL